MFLTFDSRRGFGWTDKARYMLPIGSAIWCCRFEPGLFQCISRYGASRPLSRKVLSTSRTVGQVGTLTVLIWSVRARQLSVHIRAIPLKRVAFCHFQNIVAFYPVNAAFIIPYLVLLCAGPFDGNLLPSPPATPNLNKKKKLVNTSWKDRPYIYCRETKIF